MRRRHWSEVGIGLDDITDMELDRYEHHLGPWEPTDSARDVLHDIRQLDPDATVTLQDIARWLKLKGE